MTSVINRAIAHIAPGIAVKRELERLRFKSLENAGAIGATATGDGANFRETRWPGASRVLRSMASWFAALGSGTSDLNLSEQRTLRARSRDAIRAFPIARAAMTRARTNIVGTGLICRPSVDYVTLGITADEAEALNSQLQASWERWAEDALECDAEATLDFYGLQSLAVFSAMLSGDCIALTPWVERQGGVSGLKVQLIEADRLETPEQQPDRAGLINGVALDDLGAPVGYWIRSNHPGDALITQQPPTWTFHPAFGEETGRRRVMHIWNDKERPGQVRGAPFLAPILEPLRQLSKWTDNELMAAVISAMFTVFIEKGQDVLDPNGNALSAFGGVPAGPTATGQVDQSTLVPPVPAQNVALGNGAVIELANGDKANFANPARPNAQFDPFFVAMVKQMGASLEMPSDEILLTYAGSYTAARAAMLQAWRFYTGRRARTVQQFCDPIYGLRLDEEVATGRIRLPGYSDPIRRRAYSRCVWIGPARGAMDELKEAQAAEKRIAIGVSNESIECAAMTGESRDAVYDQQVREINQRKRDQTWELRPTGVVRYTPIDNPDGTPVTPSDPAEADNPEDPEQQE
ncbi:MAG: phage portal protein [Rudaea sp.]|uniref:phage portal protein n=1 Tax=unclassified Rudaea TaxID=2627037 RepID=UPI0010F68332|nr:MULTISPECIES: phage portal protein [unclassified Rudaea]MBN8887579.1 phage portal protein [Rudaea sp.]MBQ3302164.1 phage portal protein [Eggerthellaceae bacterium]